MNQRRSISSPSQSGMCGHVCRPSTAACRPASRRVCLIIVIIATSACVDITTTVAALEAGKATGLTFMMTGKPTMRMVCSGWVTTNSIAYWPVLARTLGGAASNINPPDVSER